MIRLVFVKIICDIIIARQNVCLGSMSHHTKKQPLYWAIVIPIMSQSHTTFDHKVTKINHFQHFIVV